MSVVEEGSPLWDRAHIGWIEEPGNPAADCGTGSREESNTTITEQLQSSVTFTTLQKDVGTQLTREVRVIR